MADFDSFKKKAGETAEYVMDKSVEFAKTTAWRTKLFAKITKHKAGIAAEKDSIKKTYLKLGQAYYEQFGDMPDEKLQQLCETIKMSENEIQKRAAAIEHIREAMKSDLPEKLIAALPEKAEAKQELADEEVCVNDSEEISECAKEALSQEAAEETTEQAPEHETEEVPEQVQEDNVQS